MNHQKSNEITLWLSSREEPELWRVRFVCPDRRIDLLSVRGKGAPGGASGSFQWTSAVQGLTVLLLKSVAASCGGSARIGSPVLEGEHKSLAASLDYALYKRTVWLLEMFGTDARGATIARRLFHRVNPGRRRPGPVLLSLNERFLPTSSVRIMVGQQEVRDPQLLLAMANVIEGRSPAGEADLPMAA